jgi:hypothetical protein
MPGLRGAAVGALGLVVLDALVQPNAAGNAPASGVGAVFDTVSRGVAAWMDPAKPGIPDLSTKPAASSAQAGAITPDVPPNATPPFNTAPAAPSAGLIAPPPV